MPTPMTPRASERSPDTIVLVHGFWVTPRSWEHWIPHYEAKGYRVLAPAYPGFEVEVEALNADPTPVERLTVPAVIAHLESIVAALDAPPILMGHSAGGTFVQILLDHGFGAAGVTFNSAPTRGSSRRCRRSGRRSQCSRARPTGTGRSVSRMSSGVTPSPTLSPRPRRVPFTSDITCPRRVALYGTACSPTSARAAGDLGQYRNAARAPLLFISGGEDHLMPPVVQHSNAAHYTAETLTEVRVFEGRSHLLPAQRGWEEIADYALAWAERHVVSLA